MDAFNIVAGVATLLSLGITVWQIVQSRMKATVERGKRDVLLLQVNHVKSQALVGVETANLLVQLAKSDRAEPSQLVNLGRVLRGQLLLAIRELDLSEEALANWKFGLFTSTLSKPGDKEHGGATGNDAPPLPNRDPSVDKRSNDREEAAAV